MKITYFGQSAFRIETGEAVIMLDPFLSGNPLFKGDAKEVSRGATHVLLTHGHDDHLGDALQICKDTGAMLVANFEVAMYLAAKGVANYSPGNHGGRIAFDDFDVVFTNAWHSSSHIDNGTPIYLGNPAGFVIMPKKEKGRTLYVSGDTGITSDMKLVQDLYKPQMGIMCIGGSCLQDFLQVQESDPLSLRHFPGLPHSRCQALHQSHGSQGQDRCRIEIGRSGDDLEISLSHGERDAIAQQWQGEGISSIWRERMPSSSHRLREGPLLLPLGEGITYRHMRLRPAILASSAASASSMGATLCPCGCGGALRHPMASSTGPDS